ncbi:Acg family FMN-binding oxidoreductase [Pseudonocardia alni]|uniref:Acg family FMN-binding oxidoreductase n=1 Tax=Pseudonocardia alni TaxID=33907 RepID=UPI003317DE03
MDVDARVTDADTVDHGVVLAALDLARLAPSLHNSQPWWWHLGDGVVHLHADLDRWLPATDPDGLGLIVSCGAALHHLRVALAAAGVGASVRRLPDPDDPDLLAVLGLRPHRGGPADSAVTPGHAAGIPLRRTDRRGLDPVPGRHVAALARQAATHGAQLRRIDAPDLLRTLELAGRAAASDHLADAGYRDELHDWTVGRTADAGVPASAIPVTAPDHAGLPRRPFPHAAMHDEHGDRPDAATLLAVGTSSDDRLSRIRAGEAMSAVLLEATRRSLSTAPLTEPLECATARTLVADEVLGGSLCPQLLVRVGIARTRGPGPAPTPRRSLDRQVEMLPGRS